MIHIIGKIVRLYKLQIVIFIRIIIINYKGKYIQALVYKQYSLICVVYSSLALFRFFYRCYTVHNNKSSKLIKSCHKMLLTK